RIREEGIPFPVILKKGSYECPNSVSERPAAEAAAWEKPPGCDGRGSPFGASLFNGLRFRRLALGFRHGLGRGIRNRRSVFALASLDRPGDHAPRRLDFLEPLRPGRRLRSAESS